MNIFRCLNLLMMIVLPALWTGANAENLSLSGPISDHAVLPQNASIEVRGSGVPGATVRVKIAGMITDALTDQVGNWTAEIGPVPAGGPYALSVSSGDEAVEVSDLLVGEVWLCSGQSNMEYPVYRALNPDTTINGLHSDQIRMFEVPNTAALSAVEDFDSPPQWHVASSETVGGFSAVCYLTAQEMHLESGVPIGLIDASWGGSQIEAWLSEESLRMLGSFDTQLDGLALYRTDPAKAVIAYGQVWQDWWRTLTNTEPWNTMDGPTKNVPTEMADWNTYGDPELEGFTGRVWFTRTIHLTEAQATQRALLSLGIVDERDITWVNGAVVGATDSWSEVRKYQVSSDLLRPGENVITVMADNSYGAGGIIGPDAEVYLALDDGTQIDLQNEWRYQIAEGAGSAPSPPWAATNGYSTIYNAMIAPLGSFSLTGVLWYQGESNTERGDRYQSLLQALVDQWRDQFGAKTPVYVVQLPGYGALPDSPAASGWSDIREAQRQVALNDPLVGLVVTIDAGDRTDIHPPNKQLVAKRAARLVHVIRGDARGYQDGLAPVSAESSSGVITLTMPTDTLKTISHSQPIGFQLCDAENVCAWADATLSGAVIRVESETVQAPEFVRYCWGDAPICNLYDEESIPVVPFQMVIQ